jgi:hypothetical protein
MTRMAVWCVFCVMRVLIIFIRPMSSLVEVIVVILAFSRRHTVFTRLGVTAADTYIVMH